jgi:hypothetical protein
MLVNARVNAGEVAVVVVVIMGDMAVMVMVMGDCPTLRYSAELRYTAVYFLFATFCSTFS